MEPRILGILIAIFVPIFAAILCSMIVVLDSEKRRNEARDKRLVEHRMNARLVRLDI
jgi:hypothetical protein